MADEDESCKQSCRYQISIRKATEYVREYQLPVIIKDSAELCEIYFDQRVDNFWTSIGKLYVQLWVGILLFINQ